MSENDTLGFGGFTPPPGPPEQPRKRHRFRNIVAIPAASLVGLIIVIGIIAGIAGGGSPPVAVKASQPASSQPAPTPSPLFTDPSGGICPENQAVDQGYCPGNAPADTPAPAGTPAVYHALSAHEWALITKDPDSHAGETYIVYGEVTQFDANTGPSAFRADVGAVRQYPDEIGFVDYPTNTVLDGDESALAPVVEKDLFTAKVTVTGSLDYDTQLGGSTTVPELQINSITVTGHASS